MLHINPPGQIGMLIGWLLAYPLLAAVSLGNDTGPDSLPSRYRDFSIYATSQPNTTQPEVIEVSLQTVNRGQHDLSARIVLEPNPLLSFAGVSFEVELPANQSVTHQTSFLAPAHLQKTVIRGQVHFGGVHARNLFVAVRGRDPDDWKPDRPPKVDNPADTLKIVDQAQVVATYAPRVRTQRQQNSLQADNGSVGEGEPITLASRGTTDYVIQLNQVDPEQAQNADFLAALKDLVRCVKIISGGAELSIIDEPEVHHPAIRFRQHEEHAWDHPDEYHLLTNEQRDVVIEAGHIDGLRNGIYGLLTDHLDCHWFVPRELGEEVPRTENQSAVIGQIDQRRKPSFYSAAGTMWGQTRWNMRNRNIANGGRLIYGHAWARLLKGTAELYEQHPEWWARDRQGKIRMFDKQGGWSFTNFCTTNPEVIEQVAKKINASLRVPGVIVTSIDPNDLAPFCLCDTCTALDASYGVNNPDGSYSTDRMIHFANEIYRRLDNENKEKLLGFLVYGHQIELPKAAKPSAGVTGTICYMDWDYDHTRPMNDPTSPSNRKFLRLVQGWGELFGQLGYYDYPTDYVHYGPYGQVTKLREDIPLVRDLGITYLIIEGQPIMATGALNLYICSRLQYDVNENVDSLLDEFFVKFYGPAAEPMRKYWLGAEYYTATLRPGPRAQERMTRVPEMWRDLNSYLEQAGSLVKNLPEDQIRFRDRVLHQRQGFELSRRKCQIRDTLYDRYGKLQTEAVTPATRSQIEEFRNWIAHVRDQHAQNAGYWPPLLPAYYYQELNGFIDRALSHFENQG